MGGCNRGSPGYPQPSCRVHAPPQGRHGGVRSFLHQEDRHVQEAVEMVKTEQPLRSIPKARPRTVLFLEPLEEAPSQRRPLPASRRTAAP